MKATKDVLNGWRDAITGAHKAEDAATHYHKHISAASCPICQKEQGTAATREQQLSSVDEAGVSKLLARDRKATHANEGLTPSGSATLDAPPINAPAGDAELIAYLEERACWNNRYKEAAARLASLAAEVEGLRDALNKINEIRNSIIAFQKINWSAHIYPLVAALNEAGIEGMSYDDARPHYLSLLERAEQAEQRAESAERELRELRGGVVVPEGWQQALTRARNCVRYTADFAESESTKVDALISVKELDVMLTAVRKEV